MIIGEALPRNAQHFPNKLAIVDQTRSLTHLDLHVRTNRLGNYLVKQGIRRGDRVALSCGSRAEHFEMLFGLAKIGAIAVRLPLERGRMRSHARVFPTQRFYSGGSR